MIRAISLLKMSICAFLQSAHTSFSQWTHDVTYAFSEHTPQRFIICPLVGSGSSPVISMCNSKKRCSVTFVGYPWTPLYGIRCSARHSGHFTYNTGSKSTNHTFYNISTYFCCWFFSHCSDAGVKWKTLCRRFSYLSPDVVHQTVHARFHTEWMLTWQQFWISISIQTYCTCQQLLELFHFTLPFVLSFFHSCAETVLFFDR